MDEITKDQMQEIAKRVTPKEWAVARKFSSTAARTMSPTSAIAVIIHIKDEEIARLTRKAREEEREACAKVADARDRCQGRCDECREAKWIAAKIREGKHEPRRPVPLPFKPHELVDAMQDRIHKEPVKNTKPNNPHEWYPVSAYSSECRRCKSSMRNVKFNSECPVMKDKE